MLKSSLIEVAVPYTQEDSTLPVPAPMSSVLAWVRIAEGMPLAGSTRPGGAEAGTAEGSSVGCGATCTPGRHKLYLSSAEMFQSIIAATSACK